MAEGRSADSKYFRHFVYDIVPYVAKSKILTVLRAVARSLVSAAAALLRVLLLQLQLPQRLLVTP